MVQALVLQLEGVTALWCYGGEVILADEVRHSYIFKQQARSILTSIPLYSYSPFKFVLVQ